MSVSVYLFNSAYIYRNRPQDIHMHSTCNCFLKPPDVLCIILRKFVIVGAVSDHEVTQ